jgi:hypothetical protein
MVNVYADQAEQTGKVPTAKGNPKALLDWKFIELLREGINGSNGDAPRAPVSEGDPAYRRPARLFA